MGLSLTLLGQFDIRDDSGNVLTLPTRKIRALLAYLAVNADRPQPRERLMALLWGDRGEKQARQSLNHALRAIRKLAGDQSVELIQSDGERVTLSGDALTCDARQFREVFKTQPEKAANLYQAPFLDGLSIPDPAFQEWLEETRSEFHARACEALQAAAEAGDTQSATGFLQRLLSLDPLREDIHRRLMELLNESGDRAGALRQFQVLKTVLEDELGVGPDETTLLVYGKIREQSGLTVPADRNDAADTACREARPAPVAKAQAKQVPGWWILAVFAAVLIALGVVSLVRIDPSSEPAKHPVRETVDTLNHARPTVAVLPFTNMSDDAGQDYFSDGLTEDLLTDLSKISALRVISRSSTFAYKGATPDVRIVAQELGVSHVVEGSVRKAGGRVRINAQLVDAETGTSLWAERYDRELKDIFAVQDEVRSKIIAALAVKLAPDEEKRLALAGTAIVEAYDLFLRGRRHESSLTRTGNTEAVRFYREAVRLDPEYANAYARMANLLDINSRYGWSDDSRADRENAVLLAQKAVALDKENPFAHWTYGRILSRLGGEGEKNLVEATSALERAIELDPNYADAYAYLSLLYIGSGKPEPAMKAIRSAVELNPQHPFWYTQNRAIVHFMSKDYEAAVTGFERAVDQNPTAVFAHWWLAASYALAGREEDARWQLEEAQILGLSATVDDLLQSNYFIRHEPYVALLAEGLRKAGVQD